MLAEGETVRAHADGGLHGSVVDATDASDHVDAGASDRSWHRIDTLIVLAMGLVAAVFVSFFTQAYEQYSPIDELQHVDYAYKAGRFELVPDGDRLDEIPMRSFACTGVDSPGFPVPKCETPDLDPYLFPEHGYNTAALQLPVYYTITGVIGRALEALTPMSLLTALRMTGVLWITLAIGVTWAIGAELGIRRGRRAVSIALFAPSLQLLFTTSTVNADNALMVGGGLVVLAALRADRDAASWWWVIAAAVAAVAMEPTSALAIGVTCLFLLVRAVARSNREDRRRLALRAFGLGVATASAILFFDLVRDALIGGRIPPNLPRYVDLFTPELDGSDVASNLFSLVTPISKPYVPPFLDNDLTRNLNALTAVALMGMLIAAVVVRRLRAPAGALGGSLIAVMVTSGPLLVLYLYVHSNVYFEIPSRYGLAMMPAAMAVAATVLTRRSVRWALGGFALLHAAQLAVLLVANA